MFYILTVYLHSFCLHQSRAYTMQHIRLYIEGTWDKELYSVPVASATSCAAMPRTLLWRAMPHLADAVSMYGFTALAMTLNEFQPQDYACAPTDARFRQDKNIMESGDFDRSNVIKERLEVFSILDFSVLSFALDSVSTFQFVCISI